MKKNNILHIALLVIMLTVVALTLGCDSAVRGGAEVWIENVNLGTVTQHGKTIEGIPTTDMSAVLKVAANKIYISVDDQGACTIKLSPGEGVIKTGTGGISITGVDPEKIELKFASPTTTK